MNPELRWLCPLGDKDHKLIPAICQTSTFSSFDFKRGMIHFSTALTIG